MNVVLINQFFPPAQAPTGRLLADLAAELARRGHAATVLASAAGYGAEAVSTAELPAGVQIVRVGRGAVHRHGAVAKLRDYAAFYRGAWRELSRMPRPDAVVCLTTPPFIGLLGAQLRKTAGVPFALWCMDLYPEALAAHGWLRPWNPLKPLLAALAREERRRASAVVALGPDMAALLRASGAAGVEEIPVWNELVADEAACALGRPTVFAGLPDSAVGRWLAAAAAGWLLPSDDAAAVARVAAEIRDPRRRADTGSAARRLGEREFMRVGNCGKLAALVERIGEKRP